MQSSPELMEDQYFRSLTAIESLRRLARTTRDQLVAGGFMKLLSDLAEGIQAWAYYSDFAYRHPEEWPVGMREQEEARIAGLVGAVRERRDDSDHQTPT